MLLPSSETFVFKCFAHLISLLGIWFLAIFRKFSASVRVRKLRLLCPRPIPPILPAVQPAQCHSRDARDACQEARVAIDPVPVALAHTAAAFFRIGETTKVTNLIPTEDSYCFGLVVVLFSVFSSVYVVVFVIVCLVCLFVFVLFVCIWFLMHSFTSISLKHFLGPERDRELIDEMIGCFRNKFLVSSFDQV
jgi:hypothetical protein